MENLFTCINLVFQMMLTVTMVEVLRIEWLGMAPMIGTNCLICWKLFTWARRMCPIKGIPTWRHVDEATQSAIIQSVLDKFKISDDYYGNLVAQQAVHRKCYNIHRNWRHNMKLHYKHVKNVLHVDPYSHPYEHVTQEDWRHLIDDVWKIYK
ncbi:uncharacterized protein LOC120104918 [Phoenix dactylifera]|uniref:Uncharacterized protein LOC120104918 n=1 Tax=Phoenix dactylifera TaxID=42345 RepID=A0A8B8ZF48_PHODC|nr:uncharacterized protein LOC120104918 [Phoenix dactylifera]